MRITVTQKIIAGIAMVILVAMLALLVMYDGLSRVVGSMHQLADVQEPSHSATLEVELNLNGIVAAVFAYLDDPDPRQRELVRKDQQDIAAFYTQFLELAEGETERRLAIRLGELYEELQNLTGELMDTRDQQAVAWGQITRSFERADSIVDENLEARIDPGDPAATAKLNALSDLESELAEVAFEFGVWLGNYQRAPDPGLERLINANAREFRTDLARFRSLPLREAEVRQVAALDGGFEEMMSAINVVVELQTRLRQQSTRLLDLRAEMDRLLDDEIQAIGQERLSEPREAAESVASAVLQRIRWLVPLVLVVAVIAAVVLIRSINRPVRQLTTGAEAIGRGDLSYRMTLDSGDEFADVAAEFNHMVEQLQATTVSKGLLEQSEHTLRETVAQLRQEIAERRRAEEEGRRLQASLRRTETMSAMGALVAGVAHEVRNPLFGILSILEAMDARFGAHQEYQRYFTILREQAERLNRLMRELLEYGRPPERDLTEGSMAELLTEALACSRPVAEQAGVRLAADIVDDPCPFEFDRNRLLRVFVNLLENAIQHTPPGETVVLASRVVDERGDRWVECTVTDSGPGFRDEDLPYLFQPFFTRRQGGTGLGLSIVQRMVEEHGGHITAANRAEGGAALTVHLPVPATPLLLAAGHNAEA